MALRAFKSMLKNSDAEGSVVERLVAAEDPGQFYGDSNVLMRYAASWILVHFLFHGDDVHKKVSVLSGGERNRLALAILLLKPANLLLLDEPSNDIDVATLRSLEEGLMNFAGSAIVISHDRWFLDRVATHILAFEGDSRAFFFEGNYQEYEADRKKRLGNVEPKRMKYRPLPPT